MSTPYSPLQSFEARISRVPLWPLLPLLLVPAFAWTYLSQRVGVASDVSRIVFDLVSYTFPFVWWLLKVAPRPPSVRAALGRSPDLGGWLVAALALVGAGCVQSAWWLVPYYPALVTAASSGGAFSLAAASPIPNPVKALVAIALAPIIEELIFRGTIFRKWRVRWGPGKAVLLSSVLFGLYHQEAVGASVSALTCALAYTRTRSLWTAVAMHSLHNTALLGLAGLSQLSDAPKLIHLDRSWEFIAFALFLSMGVGLWLHFVVKSWRTLAEPLPPDSLHATPAPSSSSPEPARDGKETR